MKRITIIGGGASGTLLAVNLLKKAGNERLEVNLVEKRTAEVAVVVRAARRRDGPPGADLRPRRRGRAHRR